MKVKHITGISSLICAGTYLFGFALLLSVLAPLGFGTNAIDPQAIAAFTAEKGWLLILWNTMIYVVNAVALIVLAITLSTRLEQTAMAPLIRGFGLVWGALVLGAGMIANVAVEHTGRLFPSDPDRAAELWSVLHTVELGLGGGNEIAGGVWFAVVGAATWQAGWGRILALIALVVGLCGMLTVIPPLGEGAGAVFGLGAIVWFLGHGVASLRSTQA